MPYINGKIPSHQLVFEMEKQLAQSRMENWLHHDLWTIHWWVLIIVLIVPWFIWWRYVDKKYLLQISLLGALVLIMVSFLDAVLSEQGLWVYHFWVIPFWPRLIPADFTVIPVAYMFIYQIFKHWKAFLTAIVVLAALWAFVAEPVLIILDFYEQISWKHIYSFPIYIAVGILAKWLVDKFSKIVSSHRG